MGGLLCVVLLVVGVPGADVLPSVLPGAVLLPPPPGATTVRVTVVDGRTWPDPHAVRTRAAAALSAATMTEAERRRREVRRRLTGTQYVSLRRRPACFATSSQADNLGCALRVLTGGELARKVPESLLSG